MRVFVSGGSGFVGSNLIRSLVQEGHEVTTTASPGENELSNVQVVYPGLGGLDWDIFDRKFDVVFHQAANNDTRCFDRKEMFKANVTDPLKLFDHALKGGCCKFVYASSTAVYGNSLAPYIEDTTPVVPLNAYAESKAEFDELAMSFAARHDISVVGLRYCNIYGPGEEHKGRRMSMIGQIIRKFKNNEIVDLFTDGSQKRDWVFVQDVVQANLLSIQASTSGIYNIGSGAATTFNELVIEIAKFFYALPIQHSNHVNFIDHPFSSEYQSHTECNIDKAAREIGYQPQYDLRRGLAEYVSSLRKFATTNKKPRM